MITRPTKKLGEICVIDPKKSLINNLSDNIEVSFLPMADMDQEEMYFFPKKIKGLGEVRKGYTYFENDDVLLAKVTPCFENGKSGIAKNLTNGVGFGSSEYIVLRCGELLFNKRLYYIISSKSFREIGAKNMSGAVGLQRVKKERLQNFEIPLPPLDIQRAIVTKLDESFAEIEEAIALTEGNITKTEEFKKSVLDRILEEGEYEKKPVKEISERIQYGYTGKVVDKGVYRYLRITDIQNGNVQRETVPFCDIDDTEAKKYLLNEGDIVFARTGATVGKSFLIDKPGVGNVFASYLIRIVSDKKQIIPNFLLYFFQSNKYRDQISGEVVGAAQPNFNGNKLGEIILPIPPLSKQAEIVSYLDQVFTETSELKSSYQAKLTQLKELKASILQSAFEGKLIGE